MGIRNPLVLQLCELFLLMNFQTCPGFHFKSMELFLEETLKEPEFELCDMRELRVKVER